uniref:Uncharacterized protein n=1 Tax=Arundo donax TaxID=35708 RepID=A0A0A8YZY0_ARUDO
MENKSQLLHLNMCFHGIRSKNGSFELLMQRELSAISYDDFVLWFILIRLGVIFNLVDNLHSTQHPAERNVLAVHTSCPLCICGGDEELGIVCILYRDSFSVSIVGHLIGHRQSTWYIVMDLEVFIGERCPIDGYTARSVVVEIVTSLNHEAFDDSVERGSLVPKTVALLVNSFLPDQG